MDTPSQSHARLDRPRRTGAKGVPSDLADGAVAVAAAPRESSVAAAMCARVQVE